jgi:Contractile injection system tube protein/LysM domain
MSDTPTGFTRAHLKVEKGAEIPCWFNPREYSISKTNTWNVRPVIGIGLPRAQFGGGQARELTLELLFDASDTTNRDVRDVTSQLLKAMEVDPALAQSSGTHRNSGRPPHVTFIWGRTLSFEAVLRNVSIQFTLFDIDGSPLRATARLTLVQVAPAQDGTGSRADQPPGQNPTTQSDAGVRMHVVRDGDSLPSIAFANYGKATRWRPIALANRITDPLKLKPGRTLLIPAAVEELR